MERIEIKNAEFEGELPQGIPEDLYTNYKKYEADIPFWSRTVNFFKQLEGTKPKGRDILFEQLALSSLKDPDLIPHFRNNFYLVSQIKKDVKINEIYDAYLLSIRSLAEKRSNLNLWTPERLEKIIKLGIDNQAELQTVSNGIILSIFNTPKSPVEAVNLHHNAAWAMVTTESNEIRDEIFSLLCFEKFYVQADSESSLHMMIGLVFPDDATTSKFLAIGHALDVMGTFIESTLDEFQTDSVRKHARDMKCNMAIQNMDLGVNSNVRRTYLKYLNQNPKRLVAYEEYLLRKEEPNYQSPSSGIEFELSLDSDVSMKLKENRERQRYQKNFPWPEKLLVQNPDPLFKIINQKLRPKIINSLWEGICYQAELKGKQKITSTPIMVTNEIYLNVIANKSYTFEQKQRIIREIISHITIKDYQGGGIEVAQNFNEVLELISSENCLVNCRFDKNNTINFSLSYLPQPEQIGRLASLLEYHRPMISLDQVRQIEEQSNQLRKDVQNGFVRSIGKRGFKIILTDPILRHFGYENLLFKSNSKTGNIDVTLTVDKVEYKLALDGNYRVTQSLDVKEFKNAQDQAWLEMIILSHLKKILCTEDENEKLKNELFKGDKQYESLKKQIGRREHLRRQFPGRDYSSEAFTKCLKSNLPIRNLHQINKMRAQIGKGGTKETGIWTYVSGTEYTDTADVPPVKVAFKNVLNDLNLIASFELVSQEELNRIEEEILAEIE